MKKTFDYDLFVIGGGSGGLSAVKKAKKLGLRVALADFVRPSTQGTTWGLGGTCVNAGCIPKKLMHQASILGDQLRDMQQAGWPVEMTRDFDWPQMLGAVNSHIKSANFGYSSQLIQQDIDLYRHQASLKDAHTIILKNKNGEIIEKTSENILVAVGGRPTILNIPGAKEYAQTSDDIFWSKKDFGKTLIIGSGYIALECGGFLAGMGKNVTILYRGGILKSFDQKIVEKIVEYMKDKGVNFLLGETQEITKDENCLKALIKVKNELGAWENAEYQFDNIFMAVGRTPDVSILNLEQLGVKFDDQQKIITNEKFQTDAKNIYAVGDIRSGGLELTPVAIKEGENLIEGLVNNHWRTIDYDLVATTIFTPLEYSKCGLSEEQAFKKFGEEEVEIYHQSFTPLEWRFDRERKSDIGYCKVIVQKSTDIVIGVHYLGPNAGEVMQGYAVALAVKAKYSDFMNTVLIHPTTSEEILKNKPTMKEDPNPLSAGCCG